MQNFCSVLSNDYGLTLFSFFPKENPVKPLDNLLKYKIITGRKIQEKAMSDYHFHSFSKLQDSAGIIVFRETDFGTTHVLLIRQGKASYSFPKGQIEPGEDPEEAALRETLEETGISAEIIPDFSCEVPSKKSGDNRKIIFFCGKYLYGNLKPQYDEISDAFWVAVEEAADLISYEPDYQAFCKAFEIYKANCKSDV